MKRIAKMYKKLKGVKVASIKLGKHLKNLLTGSSIKSLVSIK